MFEVIENIIKYWPMIIGHGLGVAILLIFAVIIICFVWNNFIKIFELIISGRKEYKEYSDYMLNQMSLSRREIKAETTFFDESLNKIQRYYYHRSKQIIGGNNKYVKMCFLRMKEFLLIGNPGIGKTSLLKYLFLSKTSYLRRHMTNTIGLFFDYSSISKLLDEHDSRQRNKLISSVKSSGFKKYFLYFDGIDEIGMERLDSFFSLVRSLKEEQRRVRIIFSVRDQFYEENIDVFVENTTTIRKYYLSEWTTNAIKQYGMHLLQSTKNKPSKETLKRIQKKIEQNISCDLLKNPLVFKMYLYVLFKDSSCDSLNIDNRFALYEFFVKTLIFSSRKRNYNEKTAHIKMNELSEKCFVAYEKGDRIIEVEDIDPIALFKSNKSLIHETFFEFFVSRYYYKSFCDSINSITERQLKALTHDYSNEYADFISSAIQLLDDPGKDLFLMNLCAIYDSTLKKSLKESFEVITGIKEITDVDLDTLVNTSLKNFGEILTLKSQIIFRFGRMNYPEKKQFLGDVLEFIYFYDDEVRCLEDREFFITLLKRGCAISSSFIGREEIELDYVKHMLPYRAEYEQIYDLVNRSHTMVFYNDVKVDRDILSFRDENPKIPCSNALVKRIDRLGRKLPHYLASFDSKQYKIYCFRLFDLATIYTFLKSRTTIILTDAQRDIIENCKVEFSGQSEKRFALMKEIKENILSLRPYF